MSGVKIKKPKLRAPNLDEAAPAQRTWPRARLIDSDPAARDLMIRRQQGLCERDCSARQVFGDLRRSG